MGKAKKKALKNHTRNPYSKRSKPGPKVKASHPSSTRRHVTQASAPLTVPFRPTDRILLLGEGDFSFSRALLDTQNCKFLLATSFDTRSAVITKYPQAVSNVQALDGASQDGCCVLYEVDATKIGTGRVGSGGKRIKKTRFDRIVFNFPHIGGKSKDVARQVLYNQELLLGFFKAAVPLLAPEGIIVVTLFDGEPYNTWDLKGLAKDAGLKSQRSFRFQSDAYPGYKHARTLGNIDGDGGWHGEERPARMYIFEVDDSIELKRKNGEENGAATGSNMQPITKKRKSNEKRKKMDESDSDSD